MSSLPKKVSIREVGPREGFQFEPRVVPTAEKLRLIRALVDCGLREIEVTSFVRPDRVPQMADAEALVEALPVRPEVRYYGIYLNLKGFERAQATGRLTVDPGLAVAASDTFSRRNANVGVEQGLEQQRARADRYRHLGASAVWLGVSAAFGCNYEGDVPAERVLELLARLEEAAGAQAWAEPNSVDGPHGLGQSPSGAGDGERSAGTVAGGADRPSPARHPGTRAGQRLRRLAGRGRPVRCRGRWAGRLPVR